MRDVGEGIYFIDWMQDLIERGNSLEESLQYIYQQGYKEGLDNGWAIEQDKDYFQEIKDA